MFAESAEGRTRNEGPRIPLHHVDETGERPHEPEEASQAQSTGADVSRDGAWGERDIGGPVNLEEAMQDFEELRHQLTELSKTRTQRTEERRRRASFGLKKTSTGASRRTAQDVEAQGEEKRDGDGFELGEFLKDGHLEKRTSAGSAKRIGVVYKNLTVEGVGSTATFVKTLPSAIIGVSIPLPTFLQGYCLRLYSKFDRIALASLACINLGMKLSEIE
jgi:ATP-binding cassette subfamily G (WHITE) protein 2 (SNQ2)